MRAVDRMRRDVRWIYDEKVKSVGMMEEDGVQVTCKSVNCSQFN